MIFEYDRSETSILHSDHGTKKGSKKVSLVKKWTIIEMEAADTTHVHIYKYYGIFRSTNSNIERKNRTS